MSEFMTYEQLSKLTSIPLGTLYCYVHKGLIPHHRLGVKLVRFKRSEISEWLEKGRVSASLPSDLEKKKS